MEGSHQRTILVIGATGNQGSGVIRHCIAAGLDVCGLVRDILSEGAKRLQRQHSSLRLLQGDMDDAESLKAAMDGKDSLFFIVPQGGAEVERRRTRNVMAAAEASASISTVVFSSALWTGDVDMFPNWGEHHPMYQYWTSKRESEDIVRAAHLGHWVLVRPAMFLQDFIPPISTRLFPTLEDRGVMRVGFEKDRKINFVDASDVGLVAAAAFLQPEEYSGRVIELSLPCMMIHEIGDSMAAATGPSVLVEHVDIGELEAELGPRLVASQRMFNYLGCHPRSEESSREFSLSSPETFFRRVYRS